VRIVHPKWSGDQSNRAWRWRNINCGRVMGRRAHIPWWWGRLITVRVLMWSPHAKLPRSAPAVLNGRCLSRRRFASSTCTWTVSNISRLTKTLHKTYNDGMVNPEVVCHPSMTKTTVLHANNKSVLFVRSLLCPFISFIEWLDTFPFVLRPVVKEVSHIRCFAIDIAKGLILFSCRLAMKHLCVLWLETALATLVTTWVALADLWWRSRYRSSDQSILNALGSRNATTGGSENNLASASLFSIPYQWWRTMPEIFSIGGW
jgi:hypothetical protein